jgi:Arc/MetJ-type ribon-helix-helix transcriptional regulator
MSNGRVFRLLQPARHQQVSPWDRIGRLFDECSTHRFRSRTKDFLSQTASAVALVIEGAFMRKRAGAAKSARIAVRLSSEEQRQVEAAAKTRGYATPSAFVRAAIRNELRGRAELTGTEERIAGGFDNVSRDVFRVDRGQQALFALVDAFAKAVLTCVPEPPPDARPQAVARARERYDRLIKSAGQAMSGDARATIEDLVSHGAK